MKKALLLLTILFCATSFLFAQEPTAEQQNQQHEITALKQQINSLQVIVRQQKTEISNISIEIEDQAKQINILQTETKANTQDIQKFVNDLDTKIKQTETNTDQKILKIDKSLSKNSLYGIIGVLSAILLSSLLYWLLSKRQKTDKSEVVEQLQQTKSSIEESLVKEFGKQTDLIESQLVLLTQQKTARSASAELDHSLALKVADQITTIERAISLIDEKTKGLQRIKNSVTNLKDNLAANGYEIIEMLGKQLNKGMNIIVVNSIPDENLKENDEIITRIIKPQVNYNDKMIQAAQIEVSVGF